MNRSRRCKPHRDRQRRRRHRLIDMRLRASQHRCVFVGNIPYDASEEQLIQICEEVGPVVSFRLVLDRETGKPKGYGFCEYKDEETALSARRNLQGYEINGRQLRVDFAENDKGADRNREQGRGGPGFTPTNEANKLSSGTPIPVDSSLHQPVGHPLAATAASTMSRALGGTQTSRLPLMQNGLQTLSSLGNDALTQYLAKMSRQQLNGILSEMKALVQQNKPLAQQLLQGCAQLPKALFQVQIMLGMVTPQMMANIKQASTPVPQPAFPNSISNQNPLVSSNLGQTRPLQQFPVQPPFQHSLPPQPQTFGCLSNKPQIPPLSTSMSLMSQVQPPAPPHSGIPGATNVGQHPQPHLADSLQQPHLPPSLTSQGVSSNYQALSNGINSLSKRAGTHAAASYDLNSGVESVTQTGTTGEPSEVMNHGLKRPKLENRGGSHQLPPEAESALLQQVMNLTPEQLSSLPLEQQQQVLQLQQMLMKQNL
ncbi:uncharacterized protein A4U43_C02F6960 [Asparagus officinalis]|uniref:RRM domain-containing protein n=1 Tax=Asparagus officinalis TaxID=4686 RepID=A0A5P1FKK7_ASPOF|nr:cleavage stimulating factor 64-like [Asparagus officinalis]ONK77479.1 uncharacterized protein A4U43_C02F6960 [Asparagus officinalis]